MNTTKKENKELESELLYNSFKTKKLRSELSREAKTAIEIRKANTTQKDVAETIGIALTKIKQVENGTCKDIDAILNYIGYLNHKSIIIIN